MSNFLYRALNEKEIRNGNILIPKSSDDFKSYPRLGISTRIPFILGETSENAAIHHQWNQNGFPTRGISTTPHFLRAVFYAQKNRTIAKIDRTYLSLFGVSEYVVKEIVANPSVPEDDEVILVKHLSDTWEKDIILDVISI